MEKNWYVIHTYSGYENKVKQALEERIRQHGKEEFFSEIVIPTENVVEMIRGERKTTSRKFFPGYVLINMAMNNETWHIVNNTPKVTGFIGGGKQPIPIPDVQAKEILSQIKEGKLRPKPKVSFEKGDSVSIIDGPFNISTDWWKRSNRRRAGSRFWCPFSGDQHPLNWSFFRLRRISPRGEDGNAYG